jgi:hypothetical protein
MNVIDSGLLDGVVLEVPMAPTYSATTHISPNVSNFKTNEVHHSVGSRPLLRTHVIDFGLLDGVVLEVPVRRSIQRWHIFLRISPIKNPMKYTIVSAVGHSQGPT